MASDAVEKMEEPQNTTEHDSVPEDAVDTSNGDNSTLTAEAVAEAAETVEEMTAPDAGSADTVADATESIEDVTPAASETVETGDVTEDAAPQEDTSDEVAEVAEDAEAVAVEAADEPKLKTIADISLKQQVTGKVVKVTLGGAFVDFGIDVDGFLHISQLSDEPVKNVTDFINEGDEVTAYVLSVKHSEGRVSLSLLKPPALLWSELAAMVNEPVTGEVKRIEKFGAFVDIGAERDGLIHVSELSDEYVGSPESVVTIGETVTARIINVDMRKKQVDLSIKAMNVPIIEEEEEEEEEQVTAMELAMRKAMDRDRKKDRRKKSHSRRNEQADIIARTLQAQRDNK